MAFTENMKSFADKMATQAKEHHVTLEITSGKQQLNMGVLSSSIVLRENCDGNIYFDKLPGFFEIVDYRWDGPRYKTVTTNNHETKRKGKDKTKRKGGLLGAAVGTVLLPGVGTVVGYAMTSKKVTKSKGNESSSNTVNQQEEEIKCNATMTLRNKASGESFTIGFSCDSKLDAELANFTMPRRASSIEVEQQTDCVALLKQYKELLNAGIITQEDFDKKKQELLGL